MVNHIDPEFITNGIRLATAPVFLLTAVASMIGTVAGRLSRIIDRGRIIEERYLSSQNPLEFDRVREELKHLQFRGRLANLSIGLLTLCAFLIGLTIILLFLVASPPTVDGTQSGCVRSQAWARGENGRMYCSNGVPVGFTSTRPS